MKKKNLMFVCACLLMSHAVSAQSKGEEIRFHRHGSLPVSYTHLTLPTTSRV